MYYNDADDHDGNDDFDDESNANDEHDAGVTRRQHIYIMLMLMITLVMMTWMTKATMQLMFSKIFLEPQAIGRSSEMKYLLEWNNLDHFTFSLLCQQQKKDGQRC